MKHADASFVDTSGMKPGDSIDYDPSKEGTGEWKKGVIAKVYRFSLLLENGMAIGIARVHTHQHPSRAAQVPPPEKYISFPF
jgi:hypothetical protein